ncbi:AGE family epimerase/isomerase [Halobacterium bonnevillei]|uniref:N-acylglucosamine 2-epimerase n=1 Tax=Halobacterium bonnevillei TaxID=2692200 RepID=A0A6B0SKF0_9EURY|nr:AGE family epimerase/isomerase [Halobacterium bonnevillei]MXR19372.1 N-acylglucosamine 2-epimerase [Halobacterium bonnevillei]
MSTGSETLAAEYLPKLRRNLDDVVLDFWLPRCLDDEHGGYILSFDRTGEFAGNDEKMIVTQSRMLWLFSRLTRSDAVDGDYLAQAELGYDFLREEMYDDDHGGFYWSVSRSGDVEKPRKHLYGQSFALYGLSEYYRATGDEGARDLAVDLFETIDDAAKDHEHGGYREYFEPDWTQVTEGTTYLESIEPDWSPKESGESVLDPTLKLMNTHLHLMEAFTTFYRATGHETARERLHELLDVLTNTVVRKELTACTDKYDPDWTPRLDDEDFRVVSYGHDLENVWLTMEAADALDVSTRLFADLHERLFEFSLERGYDHDHGGFYFFGPLDGDATNRIKAWWVQAECMTSALRMYESTGDDTYRDVFADTYDFIEEYHVDEAHGEWHSGVTDDREPVGRKGAEYKGAYHNGRALLECIETLESMAG